MTRCCPTCGQPLVDVRHGVKLTPLKARIFDAIEHAGEDGISTDDLFDIVFANDSRRPSISTLKAHVWQINQRMIGAHIYGRGGAMRLVRSNSCPSGRNNPPT